MCTSNFRHICWALAITAVMLLCAAVSASESEDAHTRSLAATCASCHDSATAGRGVLRNLTGIPRNELVLAMQSFKAGTRPATVMQQLAKGYTDAQIDAIAAWYAAQRATK